MKKNFDEELVEPIEFTLGGKEYTVKGIIPEVTDEIEKLLEDKELGSHEKMRKQLAALTEVSPDEFIKTDARMLLKIINFITDNFTAGTEKNASAAGK